MSEKLYILPKFYRNLAISFSFFSLVLFLAVIYSVWAKVTINIILAAEKVNQEMIFSIEENAEFGNDNIVAGRILAMEIEESGIFKATGKEAVSSDIVGEITIINNYSKEQKLVATTRLASPQNPNVVLIRLKRDVIVPAGEQLKVQVYAENLDDFTEIKPMKFIIPGLWGPLQEKIYAENSELLIKGGYMTVLTEDDIEKAQDELKDRLYKKALNDTGSYLESGQALWPKLFTAKVVDFSHDVLVGQEVDEFSLSMKLEAIVIAFDEDWLINSAEKRIKEGIDSQKLAGLNRESFSYSVNNYDIDGKKASIKAVFDGEVYIGKVDSIDKFRIAGMTEKEIKLYLSQFIEIKEADIIFYPSWLKRAPKSKEKIEIKISR